MHDCPAVSGGRPLPQQGGAAATGLRAVWGGAHARTGGGGAPLAQYGK